MENLDSRNDQNNQKYFWSFFSKVASFLIKKWTIDFCKNQACSEKQFQHKYFSKILSNLICCFSEAAASRCSANNGALQHFQKVTKKHLRCTFFINITFNIVAGMPQGCNFIEKLQHRCFLVSFANFLQNLEEHLQMAICFFFFFFFFFFGFNFHKAIQVIQITWIHQGDVLKIHLIIHYSTQSIFDI